MYDYPDAGLEGAVTPDLLPGVHLQSLVLPFSYSGGRHPIAVACVCWVYLSEELRAVLYHTVKIAEPPAPVQVKVLGARPLFNFSNVYVYVCRQATPFQNANRLRMRTLLQHQA